MDVSVAKNYFQYFDSKDELEDLFEEEIFKIKQYLIAHFPITKVYTSKIAKAHKLYQAYRVLGGDEVLECKVQLVSGDYSSENLQDSFIEYSKVFNSFKMALMNAGNGNDMQELVEHILKETKKYATCWKLDGIELKKSIVSKSPDEIGLLNAFKELKSTRLYDVQNLDSENQLFKEANRLSLWLNMEGNG